MPERDPARRAVVTGLGGWTDDACMRDVTACFAAKKRELESASDNVARSLRLVRDEQARVGVVVAEQQRLVDANAGLLASGRLAYADARSTPNAPIRWAGRTYESLDLFRVQLELLLKESTSLKQLSSMASSTLKRLQEKGDELALAEATLTANLQTLGAKLVLVRSQSTLDGISTDVAAIDAVLDHSVSLVAVADSAVALTQGILETQEAVGGSTDFDSFIAAAPAR